MSSKTKSVVWFAVMPLLALLLACGGGGDDKDDADSATPTGADVPATRATGSTATAGTSTKSFTSSTQKFTISYPSDWKALPDYKSGNVTADAFISPEANQPPNITVYCDKTGAGQTLDKFVQGNINGLKANNVTPTIQNKVPVASGQGQMIYYSLTSGGVTGEFAQVFWPDNRCGWLFTLTSPVGKRDQNVQILLQMTASFKPN